MLDYSYHRMSKQKMKFFESNERKTIVKKKKKKSKRIEKPILQNILDFRQTSFWLSDNCNELNRIKMRRKKKKKTKQNERKKWLQK